jgi:multiple sugar transport system permease protein
MRAKSPIKRVNRIASHVVAYGILAVGAFIMLLPFYYMLVFATHSNADILSVPPPSWFGTHAMDNLHDLLERRPTFWTAMGL